MINWSTPDMDFITASARICSGHRRLGSDTSLANIYLLSGKYDTKTAIAGNTVLRYYNGSKPNRRGYGFPLSGTKTDFGEIFGLLRQDAKERGVPLEFCLCDERQKTAIDAVCRVEWEFTDDDSDYIYNRESLASLAGKKLHRKRNHINSFRKLYDDTQYRELDDSTAADALTVAEQWLAERDEVSDVERMELDSIHRAVKYRRELGIFGGVLYVGEVPAAMTMASVISDCAVDVHFEKAVGEYADNGAFTVINQCFASSERAAAAEYLNREEDMGIAGLRTAKESYFPALWGV